MAEDLQNFIGDVKREGIKPHEVIRNYTKWVESGTYETLNAEYNYRHDLAADYLANHYQRELRDNIKILDVGAGTGLVGEELRKLGFNHIDALDPTEAMLAVARKKNIYENFFVTFLTGERLEEIQDDTYDAITSCGAMIEGHLPSDALHEMVRIVKSGEIITDTSMCLKEMNTLPSIGGVVVLECRLAYLQDVADYRENLEPLMSKLESQGKWKCLERTVFPNYIFDFDGIIWKFQVL